MRDCSGNQFIGTQGELGMYRIFQREKQYFKVTAFYALSLSKYHMKCHIHESFEIMYVTSGECRIFCQNEWLRMKSGEFIYILPGVQHQLEITEGRPCSVLNLEFALTSEETNDGRNLGYAIKDLLSYLQKSQNKVDDQEFLFGLLFSRTMVELTYCISLKKNTQGVIYLKKACDYIDKHFLEEISIPEIAAYVDINKSYLQALFTDKIGCTINHYINQKRLEQAIFLLCNSSFGITDIAFASGYNSRQHFSYTFEKFYGLTPSAYRGLHARNMTTDTRNIRYSLENDRDLKGEIM